MQVAIYGDHVIMDRPAAEWVHGLGVEPSAVSIQGRAVYSLPHTFDAVRLFRNVGVELPTKMKTTGYEFPGRFAPYNHQLDTADFLAGYERAFCLSDPGCGKTAAAIWAADYLMRAGIIRRVLVLCPLSCVEAVWADEIFGITPHHSYATLMGDKTTRKKMLASEAKWLIINHDGIKVLEEELASPESQIDLVIVDECFVAGTLVHTPSGVAPIETLKNGDEVLTSDGIRRIRTASQRRSETWRVETDSGEQFECTADHPFFTDAGWVRAADLTGRRLVDIADLSGMRDGISRPVEKMGVVSREERRQHEDLLAILRSEEVASRKSGTELFPKHAAGGAWEEHGAPLLGRVPGGPFGSGQSGGPTPADTRGKRHRHDDPRSDSAASSLGLVGVELPRSVGPEAARLSYELQTRLRQPGLPSRTGVGRRITSDACEEGTRREENAKVGGTRVVSVSRMEPRRSVTVFNIEVEGTPNYFVGTGVLVHNCTAFKSEASLRSKTLRKITDGRRVWALSGTPIPQLPVDAHFICKLLNPKDTPGPKYQFQDQTMRKVNNFKWVPKPDAADTIYKYMQPAVRYKKSDCLDMPEVVISTRHVPLTKPQRLFIDAIRKDWMTTVAGSEITAANAAIEISKVLQATQGAVIASDGTIVDVDAAPRREACYDAIVEGATKSVVFATYKGAIKALAAYLTQRGLTVGVIDGDTSLSARTKIIDDFQNLKDPQVILAHPKTASHGLTLTAASTTIWFGPTYSGELFEQANNRTNRPGQRHDMRIILLSSGKDEDAIYSSLFARANVQQTLLNMYKRDALEV